MYLRVPCYFAKHSCFVNKPAFRPVDAFVLLVIAVASVIGINQYAYGIYNHCITIPFIKSLLHSDIYHFDYLISEKRFFYTYFISICGLLIETFKVSLPAVFFIVYFLSLYATITAIFLLSMRLFEKREAAYMASMLLIFSFTTLGQERTVENLLMERTFALPFLLFSFYAFFGKTYNTSAVLAGIAFIFHPLSACYALLILVNCFLYKLLKEKAIRQFVSGMVLILLVISPLLILKLENPAPGLSFIHVNSEWLELLRLRSAHHIFPGTWNHLVMLESLAFITGFLITWKYKPRAEHHAIVRLGFFTVLVLFVVATVFTEIIPVSIVIQFQLFRSFKFIFFFAIIYYANYILSAPNTPSGIIMKIVVTLLLLAPYLHENAGVIAGVTLLMFSAVAGVSLLEKAGGRARRYLMPAQLTMLLALGIAGSLHRVHFSIKNSQDKEWLSVQEWARENTPKDAAFIVPPYLEGFRVESERTLYGEWKDGTQMLFNPSFGHEWMRRMEKLGYKKEEPFRNSFRNLTEHDFEQIAGEMKTEHSKIFAVVPAEMKVANASPVIYSNKEFSVFEVPVRPGKSSPAQQAETNAQLLSLEQHN